MGITITCRSGGSFRGSGDTGNRSRGMRLCFAALASTKLRHSVTAEVVVPSSGVKGVIVAVGGIIGSWSLYAKDGNLIYY